MKFAAIFALVVLLGAAQTEACTSVYATAKKQGLTTLIAAIDAAGLKSTFSNVDLKATLVGPTNAAFDAYLAKIGKTAEELLADTVLLTKILNNHLILKSKVTSTSLKGLATKTTALGGINNLTFRKLSGLFVHYGTSSVNTNTLVFKGMATLAPKDIAACNSILHVSDKVLIP